MLHIVRMIERRADGHPLRVVLPLTLLSAMAIVAGAALLAGR